MRHLVVSLACTFAGLACAAPPHVDFRPVITGLMQPVEITHAGDGSKRLFIVERPGRVRIFKDGALLPQPFLDISSLVSLSSERGFLGLAFSPGYRQDGFLYVMYTGLPDDNNGGALRVSRFHVSAMNPDLADPASERVLYDIPHPAGNHNGGKIAFAEGLLHIATGDGGGGGDTSNNAQSLLTRLGKILRAEPLADGTASARGAFRGRQPPDPGFNVNALPDIQFYGLRNPWRFSFDRASGDLYIGDVGQNAVEEIDFLPYADARDGGQNFGWRVLEGDTCFNPSSPGCQSALTPRPATFPSDPRAGTVDYRAPILTYLHDAQGGNSVTGGVVYRGRNSAQLQGYYFYGDFVSTRIWAARRESGVWVKTLLTEPPNGLGGISAFGEDEDGEIYFATLQDGIVYAIEAAVEGPVPENVALASRGATATASSSYGPATPAAKAIDGDLGTGYWADATRFAFPDTLQVDLPATRTIDRVVVFGFDYEPKRLQPVDGTTCRFVSRDFDVMALVAGAWRMVGSVRGNDRCKRAIDFAPVEADAVSLSMLASGDGYSYVVEIEVWTARGASPSASLMNVALASRGARASASSTYSPAFPPSAAIDGDRAGMTWGSGSGWNDATAGAWPDQLQIDFAQPYPVQEVVVYSLQDDPFHPVQPTDATTFTRYGLVDFTVEGWNGSAWAVLATVTGNNRVKRRVAFAPFTTASIRVNVGRALDVYSHVVELEAYAPAPAANWALAAAGAVASASSTYSPGFPPSAAIDGVRASSAWGAGSGWNDGTLNAFPDWLQVDMPAARTLDRVVVYTLQDNAFAPSEPTDAMTFSSYGIVDFTVEGWNGSGWTVLGTVTGNNRVKRTVSFAPFTTSRIRVNVTNAMGGYAHVTELEAYGF